MPFTIVRNDITKMDCDAIVNAANTSLKMGAGVCGAIFSAAGAQELQGECNGIGGCDVGQAVISKGYALPAKYIIHTVGPIWRGGNENEAEQLVDCYRNSLILAKKHGCKSIAFPLISSGVFGYPKDAALKIAISTIGDFLLKQEMMVYLVVYDKQSYVLGEKLFTAIQNYIDDNYVDEQRILNQKLLTENVEDLDFYCYSNAETQKSKRCLEDLVSQLDESFSQRLLRVIDEKEMTDVETYKKANIDRKLFSKIRNNKGYNPSKPTAIALAIALELNLDETRDLLAKAGYTLSNSNKFDVIIQFFIEEGKYNIFEINEALFAFDQPLLGV